MMMDKTYSVAPQGQMAPPPQPKVDRRRMLAQMLMSQPQPPQNAIGGLDQALRNGIAMHQMGR